MHLGAGAAWVAAVLSIATFLLAAKSHGRQIRLERELEGHDAVVFGGTNPPFVEALWRKDRALYWRVFPIAAGVPAFVFMMLPVLGILPGIEAPQAVLVLGSILLWAFVTSFLVCGLVSAGRLRLSLHRTDPGAKESREAWAWRVGPEWLQGARRGTAAYWIATGAVAATALGALL